MSKIHSTKKILKELNYSINKKKPFSIIRTGDAYLGMLLKEKTNVDVVGRWGTSVGKRQVRSIYSRLGINVKDRERIIDLFIKIMNEANYIGSYLAFEERNQKMGGLCRSWELIYKESGILNENYCNPYISYFSIVEDEYNLFNILNNRKVMCIAGNPKGISRLKEKSQATKIDVILAPKRKIHYKQLWPKITKQIKQDAKKYDIWLVGAGYLGKIYCGLIKRAGGRAFDVGRLFDMWAGDRKIDSRPKRFIAFDYNTLLCKRIKKGGDSW